MKKLLFAVLLLVGCQQQQVGHDCHYTHCPYKGQTEFTGVKFEYDDEPDTSLDGADLWVIDELHFRHPELTTDELETIVFCNQQ